MKQKTKENSYKKIPKYWWDFDWKELDELLGIVIESDHKNFPLVAKLRVLPFEESRKIIEYAEWLIKELDAGRVSPKECFERYSEY